MKLRQLTLFILIFAFTHNLYSTHLVGGFASYEYLGRLGNTNNFRYKVYFTIYRDCLRGQAPYDDVINLCIYDNNSRSIVKVESINRGQIRKVQPIGFSNCPIDTSACIEVCVYERIITLPQSNFGYTLKWERCCRNEQVNLPNDWSGGVFQPVNGQTYLTTIPATSIQNSSPYFSETPVPFVCVNDTTQIRNYAIDPDGDSLVYKLATPWRGGSLGDAVPQCESFYQGPQNIVYKNGYSATQPFGFNGYASIDRNTGTLTLLSRQTGNYALAVDVEEWRNGVLLSVVRLDLQLLVINCPPNKPPVLTQASRIFTREVIAGQELCFDITAFDPESQNVRISGIGQMFTGGAGWDGPLATFPTRTTNQTVTSRFCWKTSCEQGRAAPYTFIIEAIDDGCPAKFINETYTIFVRPFVSNASIQGPNPICSGLEDVAYTAINTLNGSELVWEIENGTITSGIGTNTVRVNWDYSNTQGRLRIMEKSQGGCEGREFTLTVQFLPTPPTPDVEGPDSVCIGDLATFRSSEANVIYAWSMPNGTLRSTREVSFTPDTVGNYQLSHWITNNAGCGSDTIIKNVFATKAMADSIEGPETVCPNNGNIEFLIKGGTGSSYQWFIEGANAIFERGQGTSLVALRFTETGNATLKAIETTSLGCVGDTLYHDILVTYNLIIRAPFGPLELCEFSERSLYIPVPKVNNTVYFWTVSGGTIDEIDSLYSIYINWGAAGTGNISYFQTAYDTLNSKACVSNTAVVDVVLHPYPTRDYIEGIFEVCQFSDSMPFSVSGFSNSSYIWEINGSRSLSGQGSNTIKYPTDTHGIFNIQVTETSDFGCEGEPIDSVFIIHPKPITSPIEGPNVLCWPNYENAVYSVKGFDSSIFRWFVTTGERKDTDSIPTTTVDWFGLQDNQISVLEVSDFGCLGDTIVLDVFIDSIGIDIKVATVSPPPDSDEQMIVNWELINAPRYDTTFTIMKRNVNENGNFQKIGEVNGNTFTFTETNVNTKLSPFDFQIIGGNLCRDPIVSPQHRTVWLHGTNPEIYTTEMNFTDYLGWENGVLNYELYRKLKNKTDFTVYDNSNSPVRLYYENGLEHYTQCYRIKAYELDGREEVSWSNEVCFNFPPVIYIPNAFSPNGNGLNDLYKVSAGALKTFKMKIFNRWGEQLFETNNIEKMWDGTFRNVDCQTGVYLFLIEFTDFEDKPYQNKGTVHLLR